MRARRTGLLGCVVLPRVACGASFGGIEGMDGWIHIYLYIC